MAGCYSRYILNEEDIVFDFNLSTKEPKPKPNLKKNHLCQDARLPPPSRYLLTLICCNTLSAMNLSMTNLTNSTLTYLKYQNIKLVWQWLN